MRDIANVYSSCGRTYLNILGTAVAMQGDICRDADMPWELYAKQVSPFQWNTPMLQFVADKINTAARQTIADQAKRIAALKMSIEGWRDDLTMVRYFDNLSPGSTRTIQNLINHMTEAAARPALNPPAKGSDV